LEHSLALNDTLRAPDLAVVGETAPYYRLSGAQASQVADEVRVAVGRWASIAREAGIPGDELEGLAPAFEIASRAG